MALYLSECQVEKDGRVQAYRCSQKGGGDGMKRRGDPGRLLEQSTGGVVGEPHLASTKQPNDKGEPMESQQFSPADYSVSATDLIPDDFEDDDDVRWLEYCRQASHVDRARILDVVLSDLDADDSPLFEFIDDAIKDPHEPERPKDSITKLARLGQSILNLIAKSVDDQIALRMAIGGGR
jgi:hypothetical protein